MKHPPATYAEAFLEAAEEGALPQAKMKNFLLMLRKNGDLAKLPEILKQVEALYYKKAGITKVDVISARDPGGLKEEIESSLRERFGKNAVINFEVAKELIGGIILKINNELVIDASVKRRLDKLFRL